MAKLPKTKQQYGGRHTVALRKKLLNERIKKKRAANDPARKMHAEATNRYRVLSKRAVNLLNSARTKTKH